MQAISASHLAELETDFKSELESDKETLGMDLLLNIESDNE